MIFITIFLILPFVVQGQQNTERSCPFNEKCTCYDLNPPQPFKFESVFCPNNGNLDVLPTFQRSHDQKYSVKKDFQIQSPIHEIPAKYLEAFDSIRHLVLQHVESDGDGNIEWHETAFDGVDIGTLVIASLTGVLPPPKGLNKLGRRGLKKLEILTDSDIRLANQVFENFTNLSSLVIRGNGKEIISEIGLDAFFNLDNTLREVSIESIKIRNFPELPTALKRIQNLKSIKLDNNGLRQIPQDAFAGLKLDKLRIISNPIGKSDVNVDLPPGMKEIVLIDVGLTRIPSRLFKNQNRLSYIDLNTNKIEGIRADDFDFGDGIGPDTLKLYNNSIANVEAGSFIKMKNLTTLDLDNTHLRVLDLSIFEGLDNCKISMHSTPKLEVITVSRANKTPRNVSITITGSHLRVVDSSVGQILLYNPGFRLDISHSENLLCEAMLWIGQLEKPQNVLETGKLITTEATCTDKNGRTLGEYIASGGKPDLVATCSDTPFLLC